MKLEEYKNLIFDYDKTIAKVPIDWALARLRFKKFLEGNFPEMKFSQETRVDEMEKKALEAHPKRREEIFSFRYSLEKSLEGKHEPINLVIDLIKGGQLGSLHIISNNLKSTICSGLEQFNIRQFFDVIIGVDEAGFPKPCTDAWNILIKYREISKNSCLFIGDSDKTDGMFARKVGIPFLDVAKLIQEGNAER